MSNSSENRGTRDNRPEGSDGGDAPSPDSFAPMLADIRERLSRIAEREGDLTHADRATQEAARQAAEAARTALQRELHDVRERLERRSAELDAHAAELGRRQAEQEQRDAELTARSARLEAEQAALREAFERLQRRKEAERTQRQAEQTVDAAQQPPAVARVEQARAELAQQRAEARRVAEALEAQRAALERHAHELAQREAELQHHEDELRQRADALGEREAAITQAGAVDERRDATLRAQVAAHEIDARQQALSLVVQSEELETLRARCEELTRALEQRPTDAAAPTESLAAAVHRTPWRYVVGAGVMLAAVVWVLTPPTVHTSLRLALDTQSHEPRAAARQHALALLDPARAAELSDPAAGSAWQAALTDGALRTHIEGDPPGLVVTVSGVNRARNAEVVRTVAQAYTSAINAVPPEPQVPPAFHDLTARRAAVAEALGIARAAAEASAAELAGLPDTAGRDTLAAEVAALRSEHDAAAGRIAARRAELTRIAAEPPRGVVTPEDVTTALATDPVYLEDQKEFQAAVGRYQREVGVGFVLCDEPSRQVATALQTLHATVVEQRDLTPPPAVLAVLEEAQAEIEGVTAALGGLSAGLPRWREQIERMGGDAAVSTLVELHNEALAGTRRVLDMGDDLVRSLTARAEEMASQEDGGTRQVVVAAVLRSDTRQFADALVLLREAARSLTFEDNFELDAQNRQMRGILARQNRRQEQVRQHLQADADRRAADAHARQLDEARSALRDVEDAREQQLIDLAVRLADLQQLDERLTERRRVEVVAAAQADEAGRLERQLAQLDAELAELQRAATHPDRLRVVEETLRHEAIALQDRPLRALAAGVVAAGAVWLGAVTGRRGARRH